MKNSTARHAGTTETWISARAAINRGAGSLPRHASRGRRCAAPTGTTRALVLRGVIKSYYGYTKGSLHTMAAIA